MPSLRLFGGEPVTKSSGSGIGQYCVPYQRSEEAPSVALAVSVCETSSASIDVGCSWRSSSRVRSSSKAGVTSGAVRSSWGG